MNTTHNISHPLPAPAPSSYELAPSTRLLATHCCICGRPLRDAVSVRDGIGPKCAADYGIITDGRGTPEQAEANRIIYAISAEQKVSPWGRIRFLLGELSRVGFGWVAEKIAGRLTPKCTVIITADYLSSGAPAIRVVAPYEQNATSAWRFIQGREFRKEIEEYTENKTGKKSEREICFNRVPVTQKRAVLELLSTHYAGCFAQGPKGVFQIENISEGEGVKG